MKLFVSMLASVAAVTPVFGGVTPFFVEIPVDPNAIHGPGGDPSLADFRTFDLCVSVDNGSRFSVSGLHLQLDTGSLYAPEFGADTPFSALALEVFPHLEYDTYLTSPEHAIGSSFLAIPGRFIGTGPAELPRWGGQVDHMNVAWGRYPSSFQQGEFAIARLTISRDAVGTLLGEVYWSGTNRRSFNADISSGEVLGSRVPEPATMATMLGWAGFLASRRRRE